MNPGITLVLGGTRSGKSAVAERLVTTLAAGAPVVYVATGAVPDGEDAAWAARIATHRRRRPVTWTTVEVTASDDLPAALGAAEGPVLIDSLGTWLASSVDFAPGASEVSGEAALFDVDADGLCLALQARARRSMPTVVVSDEVGLAVHSPTEVGRQFADALGKLNQAVAAVADRVVLVVAGRILDLVPAEF